MARRQQLRDMMTTREGAGATFTDEMVKPSAPAPLNVDTNIMDAMKPFGGNPEPVPQMLVTGTGDRLQRMSTALSPRKFNTADLMEMIGLAGDDQVSRDMVGIAEKINQARTKAQTPEYKTVSVGDGGYDVLEYLDGRKPQRVGGREPQPKGGSITPYQSEELKLRSRGNELREMDLRLRSAERADADAEKDTALQEKKNAAAEAAAKKIIRDNLELVRKASQTMAELDAGGKKDAEGKTIRAAGDGSTDPANYTILKDRAKKDLYQAATNILITQREMGWDAPEQEWYTKLAAEYGKDAPSAKNTSGGGNKAERARKVLKENGMKDDPNAVKTFLQNNPGF